jgi:hypothetical protein
MFVPAQLCEKNLRYEYRNTAACRNAVFPLNPVGLRAKEDLKETLMNSPRIPNEMEARAVEALSALLHEVSSIKTRDIRFQPAHRKSNILADIDVLGHSHKLVCNVADGQPDDVRRALQKLRTCADGKKSDATTVLIAPFLSPHDREMCAKNRVGFVDLQGNARLNVDEVFIGKRSVRGVSVGPGNTRMSA